MGSQIILENKETRGKTFLALSSINQTLPSFALEWKHIESRLLSLPEQKLPQLHFILAREKHGNERVWIYVDIKNNDSVYSK